MVILGQRVVEFINLIQLQSDTAIMATVQYNYFDRLRCGGGQYKNTVSLFLHV